MSLFACVFFVGSKKRGKRKKISRRALSDARLQGEEPATNIPAVITVASLCVLKRGSTLRALQIWASAVARNKLKRAAIVITVFRAVFQHKNELRIN